MGGGRGRDKADVGLATAGSDAGTPTPSGCSWRADAEQGSRKRFRTGAAVAAVTAALLFTLSATTISFRVKNFYSTSPSTEPNDFFLLGGQSNMVGHTTGMESLGAMSGERSEQYWSDLKSTLGATKVGSLRNPSDMTRLGRRSVLYKTVYDAHEGLFHNSAADIAQTLTSETMKLLRAGLLDQIDSPPELGSCSFLEPRMDALTLDVSSGIQPLVPGSNCGYSFGHELMFGRTLELQLAQGSRYEMVKYASGGTVINEHWLPGEGTFWDGLNSTIHSRRGYGNWKAFVWHQGENSAFLRKGEDQSLTYLGNLTAFVKVVREEMHSASPGYWECPEAIPVVIVQLGAWPDLASAGRIREAQAQFCESDPRSGLVKMDDLSPFFHFDPLSFLISGNRIARAYDLLRTSQSEYVCPGHVRAPLDEDTSEGTGVEDSAGTAAYDEFFATGWGWPKSVNDQMSSNVENFYGTSPSTEPYEKEESRQLKPPTFLPTTSSLSLTDWPTFSPSYSPTR
ncbi:hypothetical protein THAOC_37838, partial [Thalassiosira oceanica]